MAREHLWRRWLKRYPDAVNYQAEIQSTSKVFLRSQLPFRAPHFTDSLLRKGASGEILTTLDMALQLTTERLLAQYLDNVRNTGINNAAVLLLDRDSRAVRTLIGSADYFNQNIRGQVNGVMAKRSPGSTLKPFIYGLALDQGLLHPLTILKDTPTSFGPFSPENFDGHFVGPITAQDALVRSRNVPAVAVAEKLTGPTLYEFLQQAGVTKLASKQHYGLALALGGGELTMEELAYLYLMLANKGEALPLHYRESKQDQENGRLSKQLLSEEAAFITLQMLNTNVRPDTGVPATPVVAWKTGTSWGFRDAWTAGVFGNYVIVVWVGNFDTSSNQAFIGIQTAAPLFFKIVDSLRNQHLDSAKIEQAVPANVVQIEICNASGDLPNEWCKERSQTWFIPGKSPIKVSNLHRPVKVDVRTGRATCENNRYVRTEIFEFWPTDMQRLFRQAGMPRREPPALPECASSIGGQDDGPSITSPNQGVIYTVRLSKPERLALRANVNASGGMLFWFVNGGLLGKCLASETLRWVPSIAGKHQLRVIDEHGRADMREVEVEFVE